MEKKYLQDCNKFGGSGCIWAQAVLYYERWITYRKYALTAILPSLRRPGIPGRLKGGTFNVPRQRRNHDPINTRR